MNVAGRTSGFQRFLDKEESVQSKGVLVFMIFLVILFASSSVHAARPTVKMTASPATITAGSASTLSWTSSDGTTASINNDIGSVPVNGSVAVNPTRTTSFTITVRNSIGSATSKATVTVKAAPPMVNFSAAPELILAGQSSTLSWTTSNAKSVSINQGIGTVALNGFRSVAPSAKTTYTITVKGSGGMVTAKITVIVTMAPPPTASLTSDPVSIYKGQSSTLIWTSKNATSVNIDNGVGNVELSGSVIVSPAVSTTYTLTATGPGGGTSDEAQVQVSGYPAPTVMLTASPQVIQPGESATLSWNTTNADSVMLDNGIGTVELNGSLTLSPLSTTTYTLTASGYGGIQTITTIVIVTSDRKCYAFIPDCTDNTVRIVDTDSNTLFTMISNNGTGDSLQGVAADESGVYVYVADTGSTCMLQIDPLTMAVSNKLQLTAAFQGKPKHVVVAPDGSYVYTTSSVPMWNPDLGKYVGNICAIETKGNALSACRLIATPLSSMIPLEGLAVSRDGAYLFVADPDNENILVLDTAKLQRRAINPVPLSDELVATISISSPPLELGVSPDGQKLYAVSSSYLYEIDAVQFTVQRSLAVTGARFLQVSPDGGRIYLMSSNSLTIVETSGLTTLSTIVISGMDICSGFDIHPDGVRLFMVDRDMKKLVMVNSADGRVISRLALGSAPVAIGRFISPMPITITGNVKQDGYPLDGVTITLSDGNILRSKQTPETGDFIFALKPGNYSLTPTLSNLAFSPETMEFQVEKSMTGLDFMVSGLVPPPTISLTASKTWVARNELFTLTWDSTGADYVTLEMITSSQLPPCGSRQWYLSSTSTITAVACNRGGTSSSSVNIVVSSSNPPKATISASPTSILQGDSSLLTWKVTDASSVIINNGIGSVSATGSRMVTPSTTTTYTITATHANGYQVTAQATIMVVPVPAPTVTLTAFPDMLFPGDCSTLAWTSTNATSVSIDNGIGSVANSGFIVVTPTQDTNYTISATGPGGTAMASKKVKLLVGHLQSIWDGMKTAMLSGNVDQVVSNFSDQTRSRYSQIFNAISGQLPEIAQEMREIEPIYFEEFGAKYRIKRIEVIEGITYDITYYIYFVQDEDGSWKILDY